MFKVYQLEIDGSVYNWMEDRQSTRRRVVISGIASDCAPVTSGVPEGSLLGPTTFITYANDINVGIFFFLSKFTDDTEIENTIITDRDRLSLQESLRNISEILERQKNLFISTNATFYKLVQETSNLTAR